MKTIISTALAALLLFCASGRAQAGGISGTYYEDSVSTSSCGGNFCSLTFSPTPASGYVNITNISCVITSNTAPVNRGTMSISGTSRSVYLPLGPSTNSGNIFSTAFNIPTLFKIAANKTPTIGYSIYSGSFYFLGCTIIGSISDQ